MRSFREQISRCVIYVDRSELRAVLEEETEGILTFTVEGHEVTVEHGGEITVAD